MRIRKCLQRHQSRKGGKKDDVVQSHSVILKGPFYEDIDLENKASNIESNQNVAHGTATKHLHIYNNFHLELHSILCYD